MRRLALVVGIAAAAAACGGNTVADEPAPPTAAVTARAAPAPRATQEQLAYRRQLLAVLKAGTYGDCGCTAEARAKDRLARGKAKKRANAQTGTQ